MGKTQDAAVLEAHEDLAALRPGLRVPGYFLALLIAVTLVAALLRFYGLGNRGFWLDETFSLDPPHQTETNMVFYYLLLRLWVKLGTSEVFVRTMSVVFSVATVPLLYAVGERLFGRKAGLLAAWLLALNAFHIHYAQEARAYALVVLMGTVATYLLVRNIQQPERATWLLYGAFLALSVYSHLFAVFLVAAHAACLLCLPRRAIPWRGMLYSAVCFVCLTLPAVVLALMTTYDPLNWVPRTDWPIVRSYLELNAGNGGLVLLILDGIILFVFILMMGRHWLHNGRTLENWGGAVVLSWFLVPFFLTLAVSAFRPIFVPRFLLFTLPGFLLALSAALTRIRPRLLAWVLGIGISLLGLAAVPDCYHLSGVMDDWRLITSYVLDRAQPGDQVFVYPDYISIPFEYYRGRRSPMPEWPELAKPEERREKDSRRLASKEEGNQHPPATLRFWIVFYHTQPSAQTRQNLRANLDVWQNAGWRLREAHEFANVSVLLFLAHSPQVPPAALPDLSHPDLAPGDAHP
jgi:mannosyltransferase